MKLFIIASAFLGLAKAAVIAPAPLVAAVPLVHQHSSQYHSQDAIGQYSYGYSNDLAAKHETKTADGETVGAYSYIDAEGKLQNVQYRADPIHGFRVLASNLPALDQSHVKDTPEVQEARAKHLQALKTAEEHAKKSADPGLVEVKAAVISPVLAAPAFSYSYGINYGGLYSYQPIVAAYAAPRHLVAAPVVAEAAALPEAPKDLPEVVEARAKHLEAVENIKKDLAKEQNA